MLLIPGPVEVPRSVREASTLVVNHRSEKFRGIVRKLESLMNKHFSASRTALLTGSGTLAVEAMVYSLIKPNEKVISFPYGEFGNRLVDSLRRRGAQVKVYEKKIGEIFSIDEIKKALDENKDATAVALVHNETSSGMAFRNLEDVVSEVKRRGLKLLVDSVSGFAAYKLLVNEWKIDAVATGSQKALASVPGMSFVALSDDGIEEIQGESLPSYLDISLHLKFQDKGETPFTPAVGVFNASLRAAELLEIEGIENRWKRHEACARFVREVLSSYGFLLFGNENNFSNTVVAGIPPIPDYRKKLLNEFNIEISGGMGELKEKIVRIGLLGVVDSRAVNKLLEATAKLLDKNYDYLPPRECKLPELLEKEVEWS
ncbi:alanine--glyoxylate aminotransferase family protein [Sulfurisphaera ohwakuensis]|uniref:Aminotransferase class V-fold PLP-dependent enzyme n=1 Tax=Sulfurisphaera ohwakuensis TaxID=69656 RepID=A0A650CH01_SULOH|nr:alanine--glyoxylate aminotransferase family protein [Sulfurisphaera ohwakuensis]MBB5252593.1 aspartate aminotransferase-like enzyme [Sulfurisphaera ohwakuensis]QGR16965.1 aminotransferase class V-fold PLP-dependent enzyme [Sulfurisphaera ohwakuensis]